MNKILLIVLGSVIMIWAGATCFTSTHIENVFSEMIEGTNRTIDQDLPFIQIKQTGFVKGILTSKANTEIELEPELFKEAVTIPLVHTIYHGPVMMTPNGVKTGSSYIITHIDQAALTEDLRADMKQIFAGREPLIVGMLTGFGNTINASLNIAPIQFDKTSFKNSKGVDTVSKTVITLEGISADFTTDSSASSLRGVARIGQIQVQDENGELYLAPSATRLDVDEMYKGAILSGSSDYQLSKFTFKQDEVSLNLDNLKIELLSEDQAGKIQAGLTMDIEQLDVNNPQGGVVVPSMKTHMNMNVTGLDKVSIKRMIDASQAMNQSQLQSLKKGESEQSAENIAKSIEVYLNALEQALARGVELNNTLELRNDTGLSSIKFNLAYMDDNKLFDLLTVRQLLNAIQSRLDIKLGKSMLAGTQFEQTLQMPLAMGFAVENEENYEANALLENGDLKVNGRSVPLVDMIGPFADQSLPWQDVQYLMQ